jgi:hypothetical protein
MPLTTVSDTRNVHAYFYYEWKNNYFPNQTFKGVTASEALKSFPVSLILVDDSEYIKSGKNHHYEWIGKSKNWYDWI